MFRFSGLGFWFLGLSFEVWGVGFRVLGSRHRELWRVHYFRHAAFGGSSFHADDAQRATSPTTAPSTWPEC